jgi:RNA polymerase sigma-70 factor, ECF subfamily
VTAACVGARSPLAGVESMTGSITPPQCPWVGANLAAAQAQRADANGPDEGGGPGPEPPPLSHACLGTVRDGRPAIDARLVHAALGGDGAAAPAIVARYRPLVRRYLRALLSGGDVDDHAQEVFARCFENLGRLRDPASLRSFIIGITLRLVGSERRRRRVRRWEVLTMTGDLPDQSRDDADIGVRQTVLRARDLFGKLRPESRLVLELRFIQEKKMSEVAATLGVSVATAKRQLARASARVRAMAQNEVVVAEYVRDVCGEQALR